MIHIQTDDDGRVLVENYQNPDGGEWIPVDETDVPDNPFSAPDGFRAEVYYKPEADEISWDSESAVYGIVHIEVEDGSEAE